MAKIKVGQVKRMRIGTFTKKRLKPKYETEAQVWKLINREIKRLEKVKQEHLEYSIPNLEAALMCQHHISAYERLRNKLRPKPKSIFHWRI